MAGGLNQQPMIRQKNNLKIAFTLLFLAFTIRLQAGSEAEQLNRLFHSYYEKMEVDSALSILNELISLHQNNGDEDGEGNARWNRIALLNNGARYEELITEADIQMQWFKEHAFWSRYYQCWQRKCSGNHDLGRVQTALREAKAMADDAQARNNNTGRAMAYKQMAMIYYDIRQVDQAEEAFSKSIELLKADNDKTGILSGVYEGMCKSLDMQKRYSEEVAIAAEWLAHLDELKKVIGLNAVNQTFVSCYLNHCAAYIGLEQFDDAEKALAKAEEYQDVTKTTLTQYYIFEMHTRLALAEGKVREAIAYTDSATALGVSGDVRLTEYRAEALYRNGEGAEAARLYRTLYANKDSVFNHDMRTRLDEMNTLFKVDELQREKQRAHTRYALIIASLIVVALIIFIIFSRRSAKALEDKNRELAEKNNALKLATAKAEELSTMKSEFIRNISHEIGTPLNILNGFTQILTSSEAKEISAKDKEDMRNRVQENTERITNLVNKILVLSESNSQTVIPREDKVAASKIAKQAVSKSGAGSTEDITFSLKSAEGSDVALLTNYDYAVLALAQLLDNAFKFTKTGSVTLTVEALPEQVRFIVEDTGIGIPADEAENIFHEFVQLDDYYEGAGIGLTMARNIANRLGGDVTLDTDCTSGARFIFTLPVN